jgi:hypothetical protein
MRFLLAFFRESLGPGFTPASLKKTGVRAGIPARRGNEGVVIVLLAPRSDAAARNPLPRDELLVGSGGERRAEGGTADRIPGALQFAQNGSPPWPLSRPPPQISQVGVARVSSNT